MHLLRRDAAQHRFQAMLRVSTTNKKVRGWRAAEIDAAEIDAAEIDAA
jgi:hypothetical protein